MQSTPQIKSIILISLSAVTGILLSISNIIPSIRHISQLNAELFAERIKLETRYQQSQQGRFVQARLKKIEPEISHVTRLFLPLGNELPFIENMEQLAQEHHLTIKLTMDNRSDPDLTLNVTPRIVALTLKGTFQDLYQYLVALEKQSFAFTFLTLSIDTKETPGGGFIIPAARLAPQSAPGTIRTSEAPSPGKLLTIRIEGKTYWQPAQD